MIRVAKVSPTFCPVLTLHFFRKKKRHTPFLVWPFGVTLKAKRLQICQTPARVGCDGMHRI